MSLGHNRSLGTKVSSSNRARARSSTTSCSATGRSRTRDAEQQGRQGHGSLIQTNSAGYHAKPSRRQPRRIRTPWYRISFIVFKKYVYLEGLHSVLDLHFIVTFVFVYVLSTHRTRARPRVQQDRAGQTCHDPNRPPTRRPRRSKYFFVVSMFKKARAFH